MTSIWITLQFLFLFRLGYTASHFCFSRYLKINTYWNLEVYLLNNDSKCVQVKDESQFVCSAVFLQLCRTNWISGFSM